MEEFMVIMAVIVTVVFAMAAGASYLLSYLMVQIAQQVRKTLRGFNRYTRLPKTVSKPLSEAYHHTQRIYQLMENCPPGPVRDHLHKLTLEHVHQSVEGLERFEESLLKLYTSHRDLKSEWRSINAEIEQLSRRMLSAPATETAILNQLLQSKREYLSTLEELRAFQNQAELQVRKITSDLANTHAEMLLVMTRGDFNPTRLQRLDENLREHLHSLRDMVSVMDELGYNRVASSKVSG